VEAQKGHAAGPGWGYWRTLPARGVLLGAASIRSGQPQYAPDGIGLPVAGGLRHGGALVAVWVAVVGVLVGRRCAC